jgi:hypothetical protein
MFPTKNKNVQFEVWNTSYCYFHDEAWRRAASGSRVVEPSGFRVFGFVDALGVFFQ